MDKYKSKLINTKIYIHNNYKAGINDRKYRMPYVTE